MQHPADTPLHLAGGPAVEGQQQDVRCGSAPFSTSRATRLASNERTWNNPSDTSSGRFNYEYDDSELEGLAAQIARLDRPALRLQVVMNNNAEDYAQANGKRLLETLQAIGADVALPPATIQNPCHSQVGVRDGDT